MDPVSYTMEQQHGGHLESRIAVADRTREEGGMNPTEVEITDIKYISKEGGHIEKTQA